MTAFPATAVCRLCFKQHDGPCTSFMAQQLRAKGRMEVGQAINPISLACPQCAAKDAEVVRLKREVDGLLLQRDQKPKYGLSGRIDPTVENDAKDAEIARLRTVISNYGKIGPEGIDCTLAGPPDVPRETLPPKMTQSERMKERWRLKREKEGKA